MSNTVLSGQDSVSASGMTFGHDVYAGYGGFSSFSNMSSVKARFPGKKYLVYDTHVSNVDVYDVEPGGGSAGEAPAFFRQWRKVNLNKPGFYASASQIGSVENALSNAGIARSRYYLIVAEWDGNPGIPGGFDGKQYANAPGYDSASFYSYMWDGVVTPSSVFPLAQGSTGTEVKQAQADLNRWATQIKLSTALAEDGSFGPATLAAVKLAEAYFKVAVDGSVSKDLFLKLQAAVPAPPVPPNPEIPVNLSATPYVLLNMSWHPVPGATKYDLEIFEGTPAQQGAIEVSKPGITGTWIGNVVAGLAKPGAQRVWHVRAQGQPWSAWKAL